MGIKDVTKGEFTTTHEAEEETSPGLWEKIGEGIGNIWNTIKRMLSFIGKLSLLILAASLLGQEHSSTWEPITLAALRAEEEAALIQPEDMTLYDSLMQMADAMSYKELTLEGREARNIGNALFPTGVQASVRKITLNQAQKSVKIHYDTGTGQEVEIECTETSLSKTFTRYKGAGGKLTTKGLLKAAKWYAFDQFFGGFTRYSVRVDMWNGSQSNTASVQKQRVRIIPFGTALKAVQTALRALVG